MLCIHSLLQKEDLQRMDVKQRIGADNFWRARLRPSRVCFVASGLTGRFALQPLKKCACTAVALAERACTAGALAERACNAGALAERACTP